MTTLAFALQDHLFETALSLLLALFAAVLKVMREEIKENTKSVVELRECIADTKTEGDAQVHSVSERVAKIEATFDIIRGQVLKAMHCPDDKHGLDRLAEEYFGRNGELTAEQWQELLDITEAKIADPTMPLEARMGFCLLNGLGQHKLSAITGKPMQMPSGLGDWPWPTKKKE